MKHGNILVFGVNELTSELAKHLSLLGANLTLVDRAQVTHEEAVHNPFLSEEQVGENIAQAVARSIGALNRFSCINAIDAGPELATDAFLRQASAVVVSRATLADKQRIAETCSELEIPSFTCDAFGAVSYFYCAMPESWTPFEKPDEASAAPEDEEEIDEDAAPLASEVDFDEPASGTGGAPVQADEPPAVAAAVSFLDSDDDESDSDGFEIEATSSVEHGIPQPRGFAAAMQLDDAALTGDKALAMCLCVERFLHEHPNADLRVASTRDDLLKFAKTAVHATASSPLPSYSHLGKSLDSHLEALAPSLGSSLFVGASVTGGTMAQEVLHAVSRIEAPHLSFFTYNVLTGEGGMRRR